MSKHPATLLILDDDESILLSLELFLNETFEKVITVSGKEQFNASLSTTHPDVVLMDMNYTRGAVSGSEGLALLKEVEDLPTQESEEAMADSVFDWLDEDSITMRSGAEEDEYLSRDIPYLTANNFFADISELRLVKGFNPLAMQKLMPYVCVIPDNEVFALNVNTITEEQALLLAAMIEGLSESAAQSVISARPEEGFDSVADFVNEVTQQGGNNITAEDNRFVLKSQYFQLQTTATFVEFEFTMTSLLQVDNKNITILARKFGGVQ